MHQDIYKIIVSLDDVYEDLQNKTIRSEERDEVLSKIDNIQYIIEDLKPKNR